MGEPIEWIYQAGTGCAYCKDGLCQRMNQLMESGFSQRAAANRMEDECEGRWKAKTILNNFSNWSDPNLGQASPKGGKPAKPKKERKSEAFPLSRVSSEFKESFDTFTDQVLKAKNERWETTSKETASHCIKVLKTLIGE